MKLLFVLLFAIGMENAYGARDPWLGSLFVCDKVAQRGRIQFKLEWQQVYNGSPLGYSGSEMGYQPGNIHNIRWSFIETYDLAKGFKMDPNNRFNFKMVSRVMRTSPEPVYIESDHNRAQRTIRIRRFTHSELLSEHVFSENDCQWIQ